MLNFGQLTLVGVDCDQDGSLVLFAALGTEDQVRLGLVDAMRKGLD